MAGISARIKEFLKLQRMWGPDGLLYGSEYPVYDNEPHEILRGYIAALAQDGQLPAVIDLAGAEVTLVDFDGRQKVRRKIEQRNESLQRNAIRFVCQDVCTLGADFF
ncbi:MAG TPA: hypothetical protein VHB73_06265 [Alphaproteobacteria bacterium]|nr:hypothetical protein [Alphaproteobacteria bacterium]